MSRVFAVLDELNTMSFQTMWRQTEKGLNHISPHSGFLNLNHDFKT